MHFFFSIWVQWKFEGLLKFESDKEASGRFWKILSYSVMTSTENEINDEVGETESNLSDRICSQFGGLNCKALQSKIA